MRRNSIFAVPFIAFLLSLCVWCGSHLIPLRASIPTAGNLAQNTNSPLATNLNGIRDWSTEITFVDAFKTARSWIPQCIDGIDPGCTGQWDTEEAALLDLDAQGWVRSLPDPDDPAIYSRVATLLFAFDEIDGGFPQVPADDYVVLYEGEGTIDYQLGASLVTSAPQRDVVQYDPANGPFHLIITATDPNGTGDYIRNIRVILPGFEENYASQRFYPPFLQKIANYKALRFMDWMDTNQAEIQGEWSARPQVEDASYATGKGVPIEVMVDLANRQQADPWFTLPHKATDEYIINFATLVRDSLSSDHRVYVEYSNEVWNGQFPQGDWVEQQGEDEWPNSSEGGYTKRLHWFGKRTAEICDLWKSAWDVESNRVVCVMATQSANPWTAEQALSCPLWTEGAPCAAHGIDALAIAPYFGGHVGHPENEARLAGWTTLPDGGLDNLFTELTQGGLLENSPANGTIAEGTDLIADNLAVANQYGVELIAYEGGQHLVGIFGVENNEAITQLLQNANRDPRMGQLYADYLNAWRNAGGHLFAHFSSSGSYSKWGSWGALEYIDQPGSPKHDALMAFIEDNPCWWPDCGSGQANPTATPTPNAAIGDNLLRNGDFSNGYNHWYTEGGEADASDGTLCMTLPTNTENPWDVQIGQFDFTLEQGRTYQLEFEMQANVPATIQLIVGQNQEPWSQFYSTDVNLDTEIQSHRYQFEMEAADDAHSLFTLHIGGTSANYFCLDNVSLTRLDSSPVPTHTPTATDTPTSELGPVIFDDFAYNSDVLDLHHSADTYSIFGHNPWVTEDGERISRFWTRYNWDDLELGEHVAVDATESGINLKALPGHTSDECNPEIFSGVVFPNRGAGTYHARVKFDELEEGAQVIQAFWTYALNNYAFVDEEGNYIPEGMERGYASETDIEWNNWFDGDGLSKLSVANHKGSGIFTNQNLECLYRDAVGDLTPIADCVGDMDGTLLIPDRWLDAMIVINDIAETVAYSMWIENVDGRGGDLWIGGPADNPQWGSPMILHDYFPTTPMIAVFSQHFYPPEGVDMQRITQEHRLEIDSFYYSPRTDLSPVAVQSDIARLRAVGQVRVNTTRLTYQDVNSGSPYAVIIDGPETLSVNETGSWQVSTTQTNSRYDIHYRYRLHGQQGWGTWQNLDAMTFSLLADGTFDQIEIAATAQNFWHPDQIESTTHRVEVIGATAPTPSMEIINDSSTGAPGSTFILIGSHFPADSQVTLFVNSVQWIQVPTDGNGTFTAVIVTTVDTASGAYKVSSNVDAASTEFVVDPDAPLEGSDSPTGPEIPAEANPIQTIYLPLLHR